MPRRSARIAGSTAVRTSPAADLKLPKTNPAIVKHENEAIDSKGSEEPPVRPQKRSKQSKMNVSSLHPSLQLKNVRGRRGALKDIVEMPIDILHEIFMYLTPAEVLSLSRMCKALRRILMTKSAEYVWKQARLNLDDLPDCPDDLNEAQYARLIFNLVCDYCNKKKGRYFIWSARRRGCGTCITGENGLLQLRSFLEETEGAVFLPGPPPIDWRYWFSPGSQYPDLVSVLPSIDWRTKTETLPVTDNDSICVVSAKQLLAEYKKLGKSGRVAQKAWIQKLEDERQRRIAHGRLCEEWLEKQNHRRAAELRQFRQHRYQAIKQRLTDLGWEEELENMPDIRRWPSVNQPKELTDRVWQNIKDDIIKKFEQHRAERLQKARRAAQSIRRNLLLKCLNDLRGVIGRGVVFPPIYALELSEPISTLMEAPTEQDIDLPQSLVLESIQAWRQSCDRRIRNMIIPGTTQTSQPSGADPLSLATTFFSCWKQCDVIPYPQVLRHGCAYLTASRENCIWNADDKRVVFADEAYSLAKDILEVVGFNPDTTTTEDVKWPAFILECHGCLSSKGRSLMSWPLAIQDALEHKHRGEHLRMTRALLSDAELERAEELGRRHYRSNEWKSCVLEVVSQASGVA